MSSNAKNIHMNLSAPPRERTEALAELQSTFVPYPSDLPPVNDVRQLVEVFANGYQEQALMKGQVHDQQGVNAFGLIRPSDKSPAASRSVLVTDTVGMGSAGGGYRSRPSIFLAEQLRMMVEHTPILNAIIGRRERTVMRFLRPAERDRDVGFEIRRKDDERPLRKNDDEMERKLTDFVLNSGLESNPNRRWALRRDTLTAFMKKSVRDLLTLDAWAIETVPTRNKKLLAGYYAVDAATIYLASEEGYQGDDQVTAVQLINGMAVTTYTSEELTYLCQNPRTDLMHYGYGYPPTEMVVRVVTGYLNALTYNLKGFDANTIPKGILTLFGEYDEKQMTAFRQYWNAMLSGVNNAWKFPVLQSSTKESAAHFEKLGVDFSDMYFAKWMVLLTSIICAIYGMDPTEIYSEAFHAGKSSLSGSDRAEALADARDTGFEPLMTFIENAFTDHLLARVHPDYKFRFFGLQPVDRDWRKEVIKLTNTVNEARAAENLEPMEDAVLGNAPLNPNLISLYLQKVQAEQQAQQQAMGQDPDNGQENQDGADGQSDGQAEPESQVTESGDREAPPVKAEAPALEETGDREQSFENHPDRAKRDRRWGAASTMKKARVLRSQDIVVVG